MKWLFTGVGLAVLGVLRAQHAEPEELEPLDNIDEQEFEEYFHLEPVEDPEEFKRREDALRKNEEEIKKVNKAYQQGEINWFDSLNEFADLPVDEFLHQKTGLITNSTVGRGLLDPTPEDRVDEESERYFDQFRYNRNSAPSSYSSKDLGLVSPIRNQHQCGSCVAFATMATIETCFKKLTNVFGDYSEQQLVDCGYGHNWANGCDGAQAFSYAKYAADYKIELAHESQYPYLNLEPNLYCPANLPTYNQGARVSGYYYTHVGDEELMKQMVYEHGAVLTSVLTEGPFMNYAGGVFAGCPAGDASDHAVAVVGYGTDNGEDYWLIKNSWGEERGENGYYRVKRGVGMCGIGKRIVVVTCETTSGPTDPPMTTEKPCVDKYTNCPELAEKYCYQPGIGEDCALSCGLCEGMTPAKSYTCYDKYSNCNQIKPYCYQDQIAAGCKISCNTC